MNDYAQAAPAPRATMTRTPAAPEPDKGCGRGQEAQQGNRAPRLRGYCDGRGFKKSTLIARLIREHLDAEHFSMQSELPLHTGRRFGSKDVGNGDD